MPVSTTRACSAPRTTTRDIVIGGFVRLWHVWLVAFHQSRLINALFTFFVFLTTQLDPGQPLSMNPFLALLKANGSMASFSACVFPTTITVCLPTSLADTKWASFIVYCIRPLIRRKVSAVPTGVNVGLSGRGPQRDEATVFPFGADAIDGFLSDQGSLSLHSSDRPRCHPSSARFLVCK